MSAGLAVALVAEHLTAGTPLKELVDRLGVNDRSEIAAAALEVEGCAQRLRDLVAPRSGNGSVATAGGGQKDAPDGKRIVNRFRGRCKCGRYVPAGNGWALRTGGMWVTVCRICGEEG